MSIRDKAWDVTKWKVIKRHLGYTDEEMELFREHPRNEAILAKAPALMKKIITLEIVEAHGCNSRHKVGDKLCFDGAGNLLPKQSPEKICVFVMSGAATLIYAAHELFYAGADPNEMRFKRAACMDVGVRCGGWGRVVMELRFGDR